jgi:D-glycero-D-manno-heptose 1,7-bisphosphate phosphatase
MGDVHHLEPLRPAVFLDRDGTLNEDFGYVHRFEDFRWLPGAKDAIRRLNAAGVYVFVVTNQSGVARGLFPESLVAEVHRSLSEHLAAQGARVDAYYYCTHTLQDQCDCRKPLPGMLQRAAREHALDLTRSFVVGDRYGDVALAHAAGGRGVLVLSGYGRGEYEHHRQEWPRQPDEVTEDLSQATDLILKALAGELA